MAGEAPHLLPEKGPLRRWLLETSDGQLSLLMLLLAGVISLILFVVNSVLFG